MSHWVSDHQGIEKSPPSGWEAVRHEKDGRRAWVVPLGESVNHEGTTAPSVIDAVRRLSEQQNAGTRAWLPILDLIEEGGKPPSVVVEPQKHSLDSLISAYRQVTSREAAKLALGIVDALIELGNISPGTQHGDLRTDRIYLAPGKDGKPDFSLPRLGPPVGRVNRFGRARSDAQALGQILAALLTQDRKTSHLDKDNLKVKHQVPTDLRERWITLVTDLLDGDYDRDGWDRLRNDLSSVQSAGRGSLKLIAYAVIAFLVLGGITASLLRTPPKVPSVELRGIVSGKTYQVSDNIKLTAEVNRRGHTISQVEFWNDHTKLATSTKVPYEYVVTQSGELRLYAVAIFQNGVSNIKSAPVTATFRIPPPTDPVLSTDILIDEKLWQGLTNIVAENPKAFDANYVWWSTNRGKRPKQSELDDLLGFINSTGWMTFIDSNLPLNADITNYLQNYHNKNKIDSLNTQSLTKLKQIATNRLHTKTNLLLLIKSRDQCLNIATQAMTNQIEVIRTNLLSALTSRLILLQQPGILSGNTNCCDVHLENIANSLDLIPNHPTNTYFIELVSQMTNLSVTWATNASSFNNQITTEYQINSPLIESLSNTVASVTSEIQFLTSFVGLTNQSAISNRLVILTTNLNQVVELQDDAKRVGRSRELLFKNGDIQMKLNLIRTTANWEKASNAVALGWSNYVANTFIPYWNELQLNSETNELARAVTSLRQFSTVEYQDLSGNKGRFFPENSAKWNKCISWYFTFLEYSKRLDGHDTFSDDGVEIPFKLKEFVNLYRQWPNLQGDIKTLKKLVEEPNVELENAKTNLGKLSKAHERTGGTIVGAKDGVEWKGQEAALGSIREKISSLEALLSAERRKIPVKMVYLEKGKSVVKDREYSPDEAINDLLLQYGLKKGKGGLEISDKNKRGMLKDLKMVKGSVSVFTNSFINKIENLESNDKAEWEQAIVIAQEMVELSVAESKGTN